MRAFSILATAVTFALSVSAAATSKRDISSNVQSCISNLQTSDVQLLALKASVDSFTSAAGLSGALVVHNKGTTLAGLLGPTNTACCATTTTVSTEEANAVFAVVATVVPHITGSLDSIIAKKGDFTAVALALNYVKTDLTTLAGLLKTLDNCLIAVTPADLKTSAQAYIDAINTKFAEAYTAYGITA